MRTHGSHGALLGAVLAFTAVHAREHAERPEVVSEEAVAARDLVPRGAVAFRHAVAWLAAVLLPGRRRPGISVVTPTWKRGDLLLSRCIPSVQAQTYAGDIQHVIVSDGPDPELALRISGLACLPDHVPGGNRGLSARLYALELADRPLIAYLDDDNAWRPAHLDLVAGALLESGADFAYSALACHDDGLTWMAGASPPAFAQVDTSVIVHRRELLGLGSWQQSGEPADWNLVRRWLAAGATWVFVPHVTLDYYVTGRGESI